MDLPVVSNNVDTFEKWGSFTKRVKKLSDATRPARKSNSFSYYKKIRERRKTSDPNLSKSNDVDLESQALAYHTNSGSSSNSSLSTRSLDSPCGPVEMVTSAPAPPAPYPPSNIPPPLADSDIEADPDPPDWARSAPESVLHNMTGRERKRQDIINELFHTERSHVRNLKVLNQLFLQPMTEQQILQPEQLTLLFQNLEEMLDIHSKWNNMMKQRRLEGDPVVGNVGDLLLKMLEGADGDEFMRAAATFCEKQHIALAQLKELRRKDSKLHNFLVEAEGHPLCRRLQLKDMLPLVMQRLTKYRLLFENLVKYSERGSEEEQAIRRAVARSKDVLTTVDLAVNAAQAQHRLEEITRRLDKSAFDKFEHPITLEFKNFDLRKHKLLHEGSLSWRIPGRPKNIECTVLLLEDCIVFLTKQDEKHILKFHNVERQVFSPIIRVANALVRLNAADKLALYIVSTNTSSAQMYDLAASTFSEREQWFKHISDAADAYKNRNGRTGHGSASLPGQPTPPDNESADERERPEISQEDNTKQDELDTSGGSQESADSVRSQQSSPTTQTLTPEHQHEAKSKPVTPSPSMRRAMDPLRLTTVENTLIQPSEIVVSQKAVLKAEPVLTPLEQLRLQDLNIRKALQEKQHLVADILHVPREDFMTIAELSGEPGGEKEAAELVLAAICQANQLTEALNETLRVTEEEAVAFTSGSEAGCSPRNRRRTPKAPLLPPPKVHSIASSLNTHLTHLLELVKERDEERDRLRRELQKSRNQVNALHESHRKETNSLCPGCTARSSPAPQSDTGPPDPIPVAILSNNDAVECVMGQQGAAVSTNADISEQTNAGTSSEGSAETKPEDDVDTTTAEGNSGDSKDVEGTVASDTQPENSQNAEATAE